MRNNRLITGAIVTALILLSENVAFAHAQLRRAVPAPAAIVGTAPSEVLLDFSEPLEASFSSVVVRDSVGKRVDKADAHLDSDRTTMRVSLTPLMPGIYIVEWRALTADTHRAEGAFIFRVGE